MTRRRQRPGARATFALAAAALLAAALPALAQDAPGPSQDDDVLAALERRGAEIAKTSSPAIVGVTAVTAPPTGPRLVLPGLVLAPLRRESERLAATGFLVDGNGVVATTFEIAREAATFHVRFSDGTEREAWLIGADEPFRVAVFRTSAPQGTRALTDSADVVEPGRRALGWLVSAVRRSDPDAQLTTARAASCPDSAYDHWLAAALSLRDGAAGGPLVSREGRLLGMAVGSVGDRPGTPTTAAPGRSTFFVRGDDVLAATRDIARHGTVRRPRLGVFLEGDGNRVDQVVPSSPAERSGLREGDQVVAVAGEPVANAAQITRTLLRRGLGEPVAVEVVRSGARLAMQVAVDEVVLPPEPSAPPIEGAVLEMAWKGGAEPGQTVTVTEVDPASPFAGAGLKVGDEVLRVGGVDVLRFLSRYRIRAAAEPASEVVVRRGADEVTVTVPRAKD